MRIIFLIITMGISVFTGYSQNQYPLYLSNQEIVGSYYKDMDNDLNKFQGTWKYTNGTTSLTIVLKKKTQVNNTIRNFLTDMLVGEYSFIYNGTQQANTINNIEQNAVNYANNNIYATIIRRCDECLPGQRDVLIGTFKDPTIQHYNSRMSLRYFIENGTAKLKISLKPNTYAHIGELPSPPAGYEPVPMDVYILTKQP